MPCFFSWHVLLFCNRYGTQWQSGPRMTSDQNDDNTTWFPLPDYLGPHVVIFVSLLFFPSLFLITKSEMVTFCHELSFHTPPTFFRKGTYEPSGNTPRYFPTKYQIILIGHLQTHGSNNHKAVLFLTSFFSFFFFVFLLLSSFFVRFDQNEPWLGVSA